MATKFPRVNLNIADGNTVSTIDFFDYPVFPNIGSGTVARLYWSTPVAADNAVAYYRLVLKVYDESIAAYTVLFDKNIGDVNEYYITAEDLAAVTLSNYQLYIFITAVSKYGATFDSPTSYITAYVCHACGTYRKVEDGYPQPIMKRTIAFAKLGYRVLKDEAGKVLTAEDGKALYGKSSSVQDNTAGWTPMDEFYTRTLNGDWVPSDIRYEALTNEAGEIITDSNGDIVYTL